MPEEKGGSKCDDCKKLIPPEEHILMDEKNIINVPPEILVLGLKMYIFSIMN